MIKKHLSLCILLGIGFFHGNCRSGDPVQLVFEKLTCEYQENPLGIESRNPLFSWIVSAEGTNQSQSAYHLLVASSPDLLTVEHADLWNSQKVSSPQSVHVKFAGNILKSSTQYWWCVKIWNQDNQPSSWSVPQTFEMGLLSEDDWKEAQWISLGDDTRTSQYRFREIQNDRMEKPETRTSFPVGFFRKQISLKAEIKTARVYVCGLGYYELSLNGKKVGDHVLDPAPTSYDHHSLYVSYDVTSSLQKPDNTFGVALGNGFYGQTIAFNNSALAYGRPTFKLLIKLVYEDGSEENIVSDNSWKVSTGPIVFDNVYAGETYDARFEIGDWDRNGFDHSGWQTALIVSPDIRNLESQRLPPIRKVAVLDPVKIFEANNGDWIIDFGQNISGWVQITVEEEEGSVIEVATAEALTRSGDAIHPGSLGKFATAVDQRDVYICKGTRREQWEPRFTYQGFQYAQISGLSRKPTKETLRAVLVHSDVEETGVFTSSDPLLDQMVQVSKWTVVDNLHGLPEDCPHREKCGWLGDAHATAQFCLYTYDMALFYQKYSGDIASQLDLRQGKSSSENELFRIPTMVAPGKRTAGVAALDWGIAEIYIPWYLYLHYAYKKPIEDHYDEMKEMVDYYLSFKNEEGIIENGLGDWCPPRWDRINNPGAMECHPYVSASAYFYDVLKIMKSIADMMGDKDFATKLDIEIEGLQKAFNQAFLTEVGESNGKWFGSQTGTVMALRFDMVPDELKDDVVEGLKFAIDEMQSGHHSTGIHGNRYIYTVLNDLGEEDLSYRILTNPEFPSQAYIISCGLTTWPERQWEWDSGIEWDRSLNHPMQAGFAAFFYESVAGIKPLPEHPGFKEFVISPSYFHLLDNARARVMSPFGQIVSSWSRQNNQINLEVSIPFNTKAYIILPKAEPLSVQIKEGGLTSDSFDPETGLILGSGTYSIEFRLKQTG